MGEIFLRWALLLALFVSLPLCAQELEPRRWSHLPVGSSFAGFGSVYTDGSIRDIPSLEIEDADAEIYSAIASYVHVFDVLGKTGRVDVLLPYSTARWDGLLRGESASTRRRGFNDPRLRFSVNLVGSPAQRGDKFVKNYADTIVGAAVEVVVPAGYYNGDRLLNISGNRWVVRPQFGVVHNRGKWSGELTASAFFYEDNDDFFGGKELEEEPVYAIQGHLIHTFRPGLWASLSGAYGSGGRVKIDGERSGERLKKTLWGLSFGLPIDARQGIKFAYIRGDTHKDTGSDSNRFLFAYSMMWGN
ncbi:MAG: transporter [Gammaproteobacteria bacterium]